jgi:hypothetical protein
MELPLQGRRRHDRRLCAAIAATLFLGAAHAAETINTVCPIKDSEFAGKETSEIEVGFCCENCKDPKKFIGKLK